MNKFWTDLYYYLHYQHEETITHQMVRCMQIVSKNELVTIQDIANKLGVSHNTASEHVKRLIEKKYLIKEKDKVDKRRVNIQLTEQGRDILKKNTELDEAKLNVIFEQLSIEEQDQIVNAFSLLRKEAFHVFGR